MCSKTETKAIFEDKKNKEKKKDPFLGLYFLGSSLKEMK